MTRLKLILGTAALLAALLAGWTARGWLCDQDISRLHAEAAQTQQALAQRYRASEQQAQALTDQLAATQAKAAQAAQQAHRTIRQEVARYVQDHPADTTTDCRLDTRWVQLHDASARDVPASADTAGRPAAAPVSPADALRTITDNYALANTCERRLQGWQDWYRKIEGVLDAQTTQPEEGRQ